MFGTDQDFKLQNRRKLERHGKRGRFLLVLWAPWSGLKHCGILPTCGFKIDKMKNTPILLSLILVFISTELFSQKLSINELSSLYYKNHDEINDYMLKNGWDFWDSKTHQEVDKVTKKTNITKKILWKYTEGTQLFYAVFGYERSNVLGTILRYTVWDAQLYNQLQTSIRSSNYRSQSSNIKNNIVTTRYSDGILVYDFSMESRNGETSYNIEVLSKKELDRLENEILEIVKQKISK